jgi:large subunit ribosomal protein L31e
MEELERVYTVPFGAVYDKPRTKRAKLAAKMLRAFVCRHMKATPEQVKISSVTNSAIWESGMKKPPRRIKIIANKSKEGIVQVTLVGEKEEALKTAEKVKARKEEKAQKKPKEKKQAAPAQAQAAVPALEKTEKPAPEKKEKKAAPIKKKEG